MTIEERAKQYAQHYADTSNTEQSQYTLGKVVGMQRGYVQGATEQQNIDIEKAWRIYNMPVCGSWTKESFTKAMKGE